MNTVTAPDDAMDNPPPAGKDKTDVGNICYRWWQRSLSSETGRGRAARARLRNAASPVEAALIEETFELYNELRKAQDRKPDAETLALIAISLARIKKDTEQKAAERFGRKNGDTRRLSELRFQRLVRTPDPAELIAPLRRALAVIDNCANIRALARDLYYWNEDTRIRWCFQYYAPGSEAPAANDKTTSEQEETAS